ncbi:hypothetical protein TWF281_002422 [Arthrobotrys megalospora]
MNGSRAISGRNWGSGYMVSSAREYDRASMVSNRLRTPRTEGADAFDAADIIGVPGFRAETSPLGTPPTEKHRKLPPFKDLIRRIKTLPIVELQRLARGFDIPRYTHTQQAQIHRTIAERLENEPEDENRKEPEFPCHICDRVFGTTVQLKRHLHIHGPRNYRCDFPGCTWTFVFARDCERHKERHGVSVRVFRCGFPGCERLMGRRDNARHHIRMVHGVEKGGVNALIEIVPIDTDTPREEEPEPVESAQAQNPSTPQLPSITGHSGGSTVQEAVDSDSADAEEQEFKDIFARFTTLYEDTDSKNEETSTSSDDWSTGEEVPAPVKPETQAGVKRGQSTRLRERVKKVFYTATRPRPPRFNKKPAPVRQESQAKESLEEVGLRCDVTPARTVKSRPPIPSGIPIPLSVQPSAPSVGTTTSPKPSGSPPPPTRAPPPPPDATAQECPPLPPRLPAIPHGNAQFDFPLPPTKSSPDPKPVQVNPTFASKLHESFQKKLQIR